MFRSSYRPSRRNASGRACLFAGVRPPALHPLEPRTLFAAPALSTALNTTPSIQVAIDYSLDANNFFDTQAKRDLLQQAADSVAKWFSDQLLGINPSGSDEWDIVLDNPATGFQQTLANPTIGANQVRVYAGGRDMTDALGRGGPGGYSARGSPSWRDRVANRGQPAGGGAEFAPWGGAITFDTNPSSPWHFGQTTSGLSGANDFLSVATHEVAHLFGFGTSDSWNNQVPAGSHRFTGARSVTLYDPAGDVPLAGDDAHWANGTQDEGRETAMDPLITVGTRHLLTPLDYAGLDDLGWSMPPHAVPSLTNVNLPGAAGHQFVVTYSHYGKPDQTSFQQPGDVYGIGPGDVVTLATYSGMAVSADGTSVDVTYALQPPGGAWDATDNGTWSVVLTPNAVLSTTGEAVAGGTLATLTVDVADAPVGVLQATAAAAPAAATHTIVVVYTDAVSVDPASIDAGDLLVTGPGGVPVTVTGATVDSLTPGTPRVATYTLAAPGGSWGPEDDGVYTVNVENGEVRDLAGNASAAAVAGTFEASLGVIPFDARTPATFTDATGDLVRVSMKGPGTGRVRFSVARPADAIAIEMDGTTAASTLNVKAPPAGTTVGGIAVNGSLKSLAGKTLDLAGNFTASGTIGNLRLRNAAAGTTVSAASFTNVTAAAWAADLASGSFINKLKVASLSGDVSAAGGIGVVSAPVITGARIYAGVRSDLATDLPESLADFVNPAATIRGVTTKSFTASFVAAPTILKLTLGLTPTGGAAADRINTASGRLSLLERPFRFKNLDAPGSGPVLTGFELRVL